ncbi:hypothetical protein B0H65DRAFT_415351, partial [Neurospora tetraspora]
VQSFGELPCPVMLAKVTKIRFQYANLPCPYPLDPSQANTPDETNNSQKQNAQTNSSMKIKLPR